MIKGVDVASYQSETYATAGLDFVFVKVTEGTSYVNPKWKAQRDRARKAGLVVGYYHYAHGMRNLAEADYFLSRVDLAPGELLAFDWEDSDVSNAEKDAWIKYVKSKKPGHRVLLYCNRDYWFNRDSTSYAGDGLWIADPTTAGKPRIQHPWTIHQYSTAGGIDHNVAAFTDRAAMRKWAGYPAPAPAPAGPTVKELLAAVETAYAGLGTQIAALRKKIGA
jgi:GH25 family lysozyme M1 (1,4-beta-N-acetylmuramidase)